MDIEKTTTVPASIERVWAALLNPKIMAGCVPGVQSVQVLNDNEYLADIRVKISFIAANFKIKTTILETRAPHYLRCEGTGEDSSVASSLKQTSEIFLSERTSDETDIRVKAKAEVFGRLGSFGLTVMKTKTDRMWEEFSANLNAVLREGREVQVDDAARRPGGIEQKTSAGLLSRPQASFEDAPGVLTPKSKWWQRITGRNGVGSDDARRLRLPTDIYVELRRGDEVITILWPASAQGEAAGWLKAFAEGKP